MGGLCPGKGESGPGLLDLLRDTLQLKATRISGWQGQCVACRVMLYGQAVTACAPPLGAGECSAGPRCSANAHANAIVVRVRNMPMNPDNLMRSIDKSARLQASTHP